MNEFKVLKSLKDTTTKAAYRAINKSIAKTNTKFRRELSKATGVKVSDLSNRLWTKKANTKHLSASVKVGVRYGIPLSMFRPRTKVVRKNKHRYQGVSAILPGQSRELVPGAFMMNTKNGNQIIVKRNSASRLPVSKINISILNQAKALQPSNQSFLTSDFKDQFNQQMKYLLKG